MLILCPLPQDPDAGAPRWTWVRSRDGLSSEAHGESSTRELPRDGDCVLVLPPHQVRWHRLVLPPHPVAKRAAVLAGVLDTAVLGEPETLHAALPPEFKADAQPAWVAVTERAALQHWLKDLQAAGLRPHRIVPLTTPATERPQALAWPRAYGWSVSLSTTQGVLHVGASQDPAGLNALDPELAQAWQTLRCPSALAAAVESSWPQLRIEVLSTQSLLLQASASAWNLAQFAFRVSAAQRRTQGLQHAWRQLRHAAAWRPVRAGLGVAALAAVALPPALAWRERQIQDHLVAQARAVVQTSFPDLGLLIDPVLQMRRAVADLASARGGHSNDDLNALLLALSTVSQARISELKWAAGQADVRMDGVDLATLQKALRRAGWQVSAQGAQRFRISRSTTS